MKWMKGTQGRAGEKHTPGNQGSHATGDNAADKEGHHPVGPGEHSMESTPHANEHRRKKEEAHGITLPRAGDVPSHEMREACRQPAAGAFLHPQHDGCETGRKSELLMSPIPARVRSEETGDNQNHHPAEKSRRAKSPYASG